MVEKNVKIFFKWAKVFVEFEYLCIYCVCGGSGTVLDPLTKLTLIIQLSMLVWYHHLIKI